MLDILTDQPPLAPNGDGVICVGKTRVTLDTVVAAFQEGATAEEIVQQYPALALADVYATIAYYLKHLAEVDAYLRAGERQAGTARSQNAARFSPDGVRERLLARARP